ncbi:MAG TPA: hypothetical protein VG963_10685, partial [Polyangiaceae bacterium]|nr:hypothetical protein [Polyangiaceae bacterium]
MTGQAPLDAAAGREASAPTGVDAGGGASSAPASLGPSNDGDTFFRADSLTFQTPEIVLSLAGVSLPITDQAQSHLDIALVSDSDPDNNGDGMADSGDGDGFLDLSMLLRFVQTATPAAGDGGKLLIGPANCPYPYGASSVCQPNPQASFPDAPLLYKNGTDCALDGAPQHATGQCFKTDKTHFDLALPLLVAGRLPL